MTRLLIHVEGQTEETFVNEVLGPHLYRQGYTKVGARLMGNARQRDRRGGIRAWSAVRGDIIRHLKEDAGCLVTTMVDYYGLPQTGAGHGPAVKIQACCPLPKKLPQWKATFPRIFSGKWVGDLTLIVLSLL